MRNPGIFRYDISLTDLLVYSIGESAVLRVVAKAAGSEELTEFDTLPLPCRNAIHERS